MNKVKIYPIIVICLLAVAQITFAQTSPTLNIQGVLRNTNGTSVDNGIYKIKFSLYTVETGGTAVWTETQDSVNVSGGVYSTALGKVMPMTAAFDQAYYLAMKVGTGAEITPRALLSSAPYALSLIGQGNTFPSTGAVGVGTNVPTAGNELHVKDAAGKGNILVEGTTGAAVNFKKGTATTEIGYDGTKINAAKMHIANLTVDTITMPVAASGDLVLPAGNTISYNGLKDWRLVQVNDFETDNNGWNGYVDWNSAATSPIDRFWVPGVFNGGTYALRPLTTGNNIVRLKKQFDLTGIPHTEIKVVFRYYYIDSWQFSTPDFGFAGFATDLVGTNFAIHWTGSKHIYYNFYANTALSYMGNGDIDIVKTGEMTAKYSGNQFYIYFGMQSTAPPASALNYAIDDVEIWVK